MASAIFQSGKISVITIDLDDTLWDNKPVLEYAENSLHNWIQKNLPRISEQYSINDLTLHRQETALEHTEISHDLTLVRLNSLSRICQDLGYSEEQARQAMDVFLDARNNVTLYDDVIPFLDKVKKEYRIVALSNGNADVEAIGLGHYFTMTLSPSDVGSSKPEPDMFYSVFDELNVSASSVLHIGDEPETDILAAHRCGVYNIWINRNEAEFPAHIPLPDMEIKSLDQLIHTNEIVSD